MTYVPSPHFTQNWVLSKPRPRGVAVSLSPRFAAPRRPVSRSWTPAETRWMPPSRPRWRWRRSSHGTRVSAESALRWFTARGNRRAEVVDFGPVAPRNLNPSAFKLTGRMKQDLFAWPEVEGDANIHGPLSFAIPSSTAGYAHMHGAWGKLPLAEIIAPAIALAKRGLPQDWYTTLKVGSSASVLRRYAESARIYLPDGLPPVAPYQGSPGFFRLGALADTLEHLARAGSARSIRGRYRRRDRRRRQGNGRCAFG